MEFKINGSTWHIKEISKEEMDYDNGKEGYYTHGYTSYSKNTIFINETSKEKERTLKHELMHCWLYMYGHNQEGKQFNNEDICEIVASSNDFINEIVKTYFNPRILDLEKPPLIYIQGIKELDKDAENSYIINQLIKAVKQLDN